MEEWELIVEHLQSVVTDAKEKPREPEPFEIEMKALGDRLEWLQDILAHADQYALEEFVDAFVNVSGNSSHYHRFVHDALVKEK